MADVTRKIHVEVVTFDPAQGKLIPVPNAKLLVEDDGWFYDPNISSGDDAMGADGSAEIDVTFDESDENSINPYFTITIPDADRDVPAGAAADKQFKLPDEWVTQHEHQRRVPRISDHTDPNNPLKIYVGVHGQLRVAYTDFHPSGKRNPLALPEKAVRIYLADYDTFLWIDFLNPDDTLGGFAYDPKTGKTIAIGDEDQYPYFDTWPTAPRAQDGFPATPRAWIDPPEAPVGTLGSGSFASVGALAVDLHGFIFLCDGNDVHRFYPDGTFDQTIVTGIGAPQGVAVDQYRNLYIADTTNDRIRVYRPRSLDGQSGEYSLVTDVRNGFDQPRGVCVVPNRVVDGDEWLAVVDGNNDRVQVFRITFSASGSSVRARGNPASALTHLATFGTTGNGAAQFSNPVAIAADRQKRLYISDTTLHRVARWRFDDGTNSYVHDHNFGKAGNASGNGNGEFNAPKAVAFDLKNQFLYVGDSGNNRLQRIDATSNAHLVNVAGVNDCVGLGVDGRGEVFSADNSQTRIRRHTPYQANGSPLANNAAPTLVGDAWTPRSEPAHMHTPRYLTFDKADNLWVSDSGNNRILRFDKQPNGELQLVTPPPALAGLSNPIGIAIDPDDDHIYIADAGNDRVRHFDGSFAHQADIGSGGANPLDNPHGVAIVRRAEKRLYIADRDNDRVQVYRLDGTHVANITSGSGSAFDKPEDVAVDSRGNLYVADTGNRRIVQFDDSDTAVRAIRLRDTGFSFGAPCGLSVDSDDKLIVTDRGANSVYRIDADGDVLAFWDMNSVVRMQTLSPVYAAKKGRVSFQAGLATESYNRDFYGTEAHIVKTAGTLRLTPDDGSAASNVGLNVGTLLFVKDGKKVDKRDLLHATLGEDAYFPELARLLRFNAPSRTVITDAGLLAVADTDHARVRLIRTQTALNLNLFDLGESLPDISFRAVTEVDWRDEDGLEVKVNNVPFDGAAVVLKQIPVLGYLLGGISNISFSANDFVTEPEDDFSADTYTATHQLDHAHLVSTAINALRVVRQAQRWLKHLTREDEAAHRWGVDDNKHTLKIDLIKSPGAYHPWFAESINIGTDEHGHGNTGWDDGVVVHEMFHWVFDKSVRPFPPFSLVGGTHRRSQITSKNLCITEGYAEYNQLFWGGEFSGHDRVRGFRPTRGFSGLLAELDEYDDNDNIRNRFFLFGGAFAATVGTVPLFDKPNSGQKVEGYFANALYQIHHALVEPNILFADQPPFWHGYNNFIDTTHAQRFAQIIRKAMRDFPDGGFSSDSWKGGSEQYCKQVLKAAGAVSADFKQIVQSILELNNLLNPVLSVTTGTSTSAAGDEIDGAITLAETDTHSFIVRLANANDEPLADYNVHFVVTTAADYSFSGINPSAQRGHAPTPGLNHTTNANGIVNITFEAPPGSSGRNETMTVSYQPNFDTDATFSPPERGDDLDTTLRRAYLYELRAANKVWAGTDNNLGAQVTKSFTINVS